MSYALDETCKSQQIGPSEHVCMQQAGADMRTLRCHNHIPWYVECVQNVTCARMRTKHHLAVRCWRPLAMSQSGRARRLSARSRLRKPASLVQRRLQPFQMSLKTKAVLRGGA